MVSQPRDAYNENDVVIYHPRLGAFTTSATQSPQCDAEPAMFCLNQAEKRWLQSEFTRVREITTLTGDLNTLKT
jgi:hypothetical protein